MGTDRGSYPDHPRGISVVLTEREMRLLVHAAALGANLISDSEERRQLRELLTKLQGVTDATP